MQTVYAIIGFPVGQARSPQVFNTIFAARGDDAVMVPMEVDPKAFVATVAGLRNIENFGGLVVTVPHKLAAADVALRKSRRAELVGAANVLRPYGGDGWEADLLDGAGFVAGLRSLRFSLQGKRIAVVGAGGSGLAIAEAVLAEGAEVLISDIDSGRVDRAIARIAPAYPGAIAEGTPGGSCDLAVNATPVGMNGDQNMSFDPACLASTAIIAEVIMKPPLTPLLKRAQTLGLATHEGRHMLDGQVDPIYAFLRPEASRG